MSDPNDAPLTLWGPDGRRAAVSVTFDNLGEAADLERGLWPAGEPLGEHFSVKRTLPRILGLLDELGIRATFFVEGLNARLYPEALLEIVDRGHDLGYHGWRHESWAGLSPSEEARLLERGVQEMDRIDVRPRGFRPPGGRLNPSSLGLLKDLGFTYCSPAGRGVGVLEDVVILPFEWRLIDAYYYLPRFGGLREADTGSSEPLAPSRFGETIRARLEKTVRGGSHVSLLFHPFLEEQDDRFRVMREVLQALQKLMDDGVVWCATYREMAPWLRSHLEEFDGGLRLDLTET
ncbi:Polysaccharide deacetylase [Rubrobacter radiotolerans]|uniref:Polysaccharide deacetylase n=1 Tax=Rubrobacter radiotolerans TaxID=42256 RepID=A0A023X4M2_RUBRA|nr:polysaccharide deacetylase family protein [Rubrobacter radiotolerans]AHY46999.1 Polysaccharide deacetylase [Rubrobacter radiotolerans]MDX5894405.1 polysaccharide deacetylase family protein [Rubrobacter radiotolerans]SMC05932.1 Polysaccharide deacetylase [Rubrobacter radiotolerans DSM 5868]